MLFFFPTIDLPLEDFKVAENLTVLAFFLEIFLAFKICFTTILFETFAPLYSVVIAYVLGIKLIFKDAYAFLSVFTEYVLP